MRFALLVLVAGLVATPAVFAQEDPGLPPPHAPTSNVIRGVDVSVYQGNIDWPRVANAGIKFAFIRESDGFHQDTKFERNWTEAKAAGVVRGAYQYFRASRDGAEQANAFLSRLTADSGELPLVADVETLDGVNRAKLQTELAKWVATVANRTGRAPMIYTAPGLWNGWHMPASFSEHPLWVAHWTTATHPRLPAGWSDWTFWQYRSDAAVPGIPGRVDADLFRGSLDDLKDLAATGAARTIASAAPQPTTPATIPGTNGGPTPGGPTPGMTSTIPGSNETAPAGGGSESIEDHLPLLRRGAAGANVRKLQRLLAAKGAKLDVDGIYGPKTEAAVRAFQKTHDCKIDGIVGPETWGALQRDDAP